MTKPTLSLRAGLLLCLVFAFPICCYRTLAQQTAADKPLMLVTWFGKGTIPLPAGDNWKPQMITVYDHDQRPVAQFTKSEAGITVSFILFENQSGQPSAEGCRKDAITPILDHDSKLISQHVDGEAKNKAGDNFATTTYLVDMSPLKGHHQSNLFAFAGNATTCAEIHISGVDESSGGAGALTAVLGDFHPDLTYKPSADDYFRFASILFRGAPGLAAPYYKASLDAMPDGANKTVMHRVATDQLVMSLGMSGDLKDSRVLAEQAIAADPDYPINYYNLACADAEEGNADQARLHLQQAFDRRANVNPGEAMPNPTTDDSIRKLKKNAAFWSFVKELPRN